MSTGPRVLSRNTVPPPSWKIQETVSLSDLGCIEDAQVRCAAKQAAPTLRHQAVTLIEAVQALKLVIVANKGELAPLFHREKIHPIVEHVWFTRRNSRGTRKTAMETLRDLYVPPSCVSHRL